MKNERKRERNAVLRPGCSNTLPAAWKVDAGQSQSRVVFLSLIFRRRSTSSLLSSSHLKIERQEMLFLCIISECLDQRCSHSVSKSGYTLSVNIQHYNSYPLTITTFQPLRMFNLKQLHFICSSFLSFVCFPFLSFYDSLLWLKSLYERLDFHFGLPLSCRSP